MEKSSFEVVVGGSCTLRRFYHAPKT